MLLKQVNNRDNMIAILNNEVEEMAGIKDIIYTPENVDIAKNTKEEFEVLNGMFQGNYAFEERKALRDVKLAKIIDML